MPFRPPGILYSESESVEDGKWHHSCSTWDADGRCLRTYVDGELRNLIFFTPVPFALPREPSIFGGYRMPDLHDPSGLVHRELHVADAAECIYERLPHTVLYVFDTNSRGEELELFHGRHWWIEREGKWAGHIRLRFQPAGRVTVTFRREA